jgi:hypothetical protein
MSKPGCRALEYRERRSVERASREKSKSGINKIPKLTGFDDFIYYCVLSINGKMIM